MTVRNYGPTAQAVTPAAAADVKVTYPDGTVPTFTTPVAIDGQGHVSFAIDDAGNPPIHVLIEVQNPTGAHSTARAVLGPDGTAPTAVAGAAAGTAPTGVGVTGHDDGGVVSLTTGAAATAAGLLATVTFAQPRNAAPDEVQLTPANDASNAAGGEVRNVTAAGFDIYVAAAPAVSTALAYEFEAAHVQPVTIQTYGPTVLPVLPATASE